MSEEAPAAQPQQSFAERKASQLREERVVREAQAESRPEVEAAPATTSPELESAPLEGNDGYPEEEPSAVDSEYEEEQAELFDAPEGTSDDETEAEFESERAIDWEKQFKDTQKKLSEVTENRAEREREQADMMAESLTMRHQLEDTYTEAKRYADVYRTGYDQQIAGLEQAFNTGQIPPDDLPQARQAYQNLVNQRNAIQQQVEQINTQEREMKDKQRERQAEVARVRLSRTIPGWGRAKYNELGEYAQSRGFSSEEFSENTDHRFMELLHDSMQLNRAAGTVKEVRRKSKAGGPKRNARQQPRSADGKYRRAKDEFQRNPNQKGRFAEMKLREMQRDNRKR